ncbi:unnamed protein product [Gongylonema pulchrum]|uniref:Uncharacterized protein n=1 Tax=Gongylonema pulchrum TaxID=637853 RepID=A0A183EP22_9BILA|nr:unnamed protein product [Gongylonema pulchrum]
MVLLKAMSPPTESLNARAQTTKLTVTALMEMVIVTVMDYGDSDDDIDNVNIKRDIDDDIDNVNIKRDM